MLEFKWEIKNRGKNKHVGDCDYIVKCQMLTDKMYITIFNDISYLGSFENEINFESLETNIRNLNSKLQSSNSRLTHKKNKQTRSKHWTTTPFEITTTDDNVNKNTLYIL